MTTKEIIAQVARENHMTSEEVEKEMRQAIRAAMATTDPHAQALWKQIAPDGKEPSIETFLNYCVNRLNEMRCNRK